MAEAREIVERMAGRMEREVRDYWLWYKAARQHHGALVSTSAHLENEQKAKEADALRSLLADSLQPDLLSKSKGAN